MVAVKTRIFGNMKKKSTGKRVILGQPSSCLSANDLFTHNKLPEKVASSVSKLSNNHAELSSITDSDINPKENKPNLFGHH